MREESHKESANSVNPNPDGAPSESHEYRTSGSESGAKGRKVINNPPEEVTVRKVSNHSYLRLRRNRTAAMKAAAVATREELKEEEEAEEPEEEDPGESAWGRLEEE